jgi:hypothetical protein
MKPIDESLVAEIEAAWEVQFTPTQRDELLELRRSALPHINKRGLSPQRPGGSRPGAPPKDNLRQFLVEFALHYERVGGDASGGWAREGRTKRITGKFADGLRVVWAALPQPKPPLERSARHAKNALSPGWKGKGLDVRLADGEVGERPAAVASAC